MRSSRFNAALFDERCVALGAATEVAKAALVEVDYATLYRIRKGDFNPRLTAALRFASKLGVTVEQLWPESAS